MKSYENAIILQIFSFIKTIKNYLPFAILFPIIAKIMERLAEGWFLAALLHLPLALKVLHLL